MPLHSTAPPPFLPLLLSLSSPVSHTYTHIHTYTHAHTHTSTPHTHTDFPPHTPHPVLPPTHRCSDPVLRPSGGAGVGGSDPPEEVYEDVYEGTGASHVVWGLKGGHAYFFRLKSVAANNASSSWGVPLK
eukprot:216196-Rhodomonas_salina.1